MTTAEIVTRTLEILGNDSAFYRPDEVILNGLNPALILLVLLKPELGVQRHPITWQPDELFLDMLKITPRFLRLKRLVLGDVTSDVPVESNGWLRDLRPAGLFSLLRQRLWPLVRRDRPELVSQYGWAWRLLWPRSIQVHTLTAVIQESPAPLVANEPNRAPDIPEGYQDLLPPIAAAILSLKEGGQTTQQATERLGAALGKEHFTGMRQAVGQAQRQAVMTTAGG